MIIYFSATGNTKYCAEFISHSINDSNILSLNDMMKSGHDEINCGGEKRIGIFSPVYDWDMSYAVSEFLRGLTFQNLSDDCYVYGVFTCGGASGVSCKTLKSILSDKGINLSASFAVAMPDNFVPLIPQKSEDEKQLMLSEADKALQGIANDIESRRNILTVKGRKLPGFMMFMIRKFFIPSQKKVKGFTVNDSCTGCGLCERVCPMNIIVMKDNRPSWTADKCACCLACLHRCPNHAINRWRSAKNRRYINPNVSL